MSHLSERATLLGCPPEIRLNIYDFVVHSDIEHTIVQDILHIREPRSGTQAKFLFDVDLDKSTKLSDGISWITLRRCCKTILHELDHFMNEAISANDGRNETYASEIQVFNAEQAKSSRRIVWKQLPCSPGLLRHLEVNVVTHYGSGPWTEGGPASLTRAIFQLMNHLCHKGPQLRKVESLATPVHLETLIINIDIGSETRPPRFECNTQPDYNYADFIAGLNRLAKSGVLLGHLRYIVVRNNLGDVQEMLVECKSTPALYGPWTTFGFSWGC